MTVVLNWFVLLALLMYLPVVCVKLFQLIKLFPLSDLIYNSVPDGGALIVLFVKVLLFAENLRAIPYHAVVLVVPVLFINLLFDDVQRSIPVKVLLIPILFVRLL